MPQTSQDIMKRFWQVGAVRPKQVEGVKGYKDRRREEGRMERERERMHKLKLTKGKQMPNIANKTTGKNSVNKG